MVVPVHPEHGERLAGHVGALLQPVRLDHRPDARAEPLHLHLELSGHPVLSQPLEGGTGESPVIPKPINSNHFTNRVLWYGAAYGAYPVIHPFMDDFSCVSFWELLYQ